eukprot:1891934-Prymnesium_polylepis.1
MTGKVDVTNAHSATAFATLSKSSMVQKVWPSKHHRGSTPQDSQRAGRSAECYRARSWVRSPMAHTVYLHVSKALQQLASVHVRAAEAGELVSYDVAVMRARCPVRREALVGLE